MVIISFLLSVVGGALSAVIVGAATEVARAWANKERRHAIRERTFRENMHALLS